MNLNIEAGDLVQWKQPMDANEAYERFRVIEMKGDRCDIQFVCDLTFPPIKTVLVNELKVVCVSDAEAK